MPSLSLASNQGQIEQWSTALLGTAQGTTNWTQVSADITSYGGVANTLNAYYTYLFGNATAATVAQTLLTNMNIVAGQNGLSAADVSVALSALTAYIGGTAASQRGAAIQTWLNTVATYTTATVNGNVNDYAGAVTALNTSVSNAIAYVQAGNAATVANTPAAPNSAVTAAATAATSTTFLLTTGQDTQTANTFYGVINGSTGTPTTVQGFDKLTGATGSTTNLLSLTSPGNTSGTAQLGGGGVASDTLPAGLSLTNIQSITLNSSANAGNGVAFDVSGLSSVTSLAVTSAGPFTDNIKASSAQSVTDTYNGTGTTAAHLSIQVVGGSNVTVTDNSTLASGGSTPGTEGIKIGGGTVATDPSGAVVVNENNATGTTAVLVDGGTTVTVTASAPSDAITIGATVAATGAVVVNESGGATPIIIGAAAVLAASTVNVNVTGAGDGVTVYGGSTDTIVAGPASTAVAGALGATTLVGGTTTNVTITNTGTSRLATSAVAVDNAAAVTITSTGGNITVGGTGGTNVVSGTLNITNKDSATSSSTTANLNDLIAVGATGSVTGAVNITTTALVGTNANTIAVGTTTASQDPTGAVTIVDETMGSGTTVYSGVGHQAVFVNGAHSVSVTGGGQTGIDDQASTLALATVSLSNVKGAVTIGGNTADTALATLTINNSLAAPTSSNTGTSGVATALGGAAVATTVVVDGGSVPTAGRTLTLNLSGDTHASTAITDSYASTISVVATGAANNITLTDAYANATNGQNYSFTNTGTGTLTVGGITDTSALGTVAITVAGTGVVALGNLSGLSVAPATITTTDTGGVSVEISGLSTSFVGGTTGNNIVSIDSNAGTGILSENGGTGGNNTLIFKATSAHLAPVSNFTPSFSNFQTLGFLPGADGTYNMTSAPYTTIEFGAATGATSGLSLTNVTAGTTIASAIPLSTASVSTAASTVLLLSGHNGTTDTVSTTINGITSATITDTNVDITNANNLVTAINNLHIAGVSAADGGTATVTVTGAAIVTETVAGTGGVKVNANGAGTNTPASIYAVTEGLAAASISGVTNTLPITAGGGTLTLNEANEQTVAVTATASTTSVLDLTDATTNAGSQSNPVTKITVGGSGGVTLNYMLTGNATDGLATINASASTGAVTTTGVQGAIGGLTITGGTSGTGLLTASGSGMATSNNFVNTGAATASVNGVSLGSFLTATDTITSGAGGSVVNVGYAGAGGSAGTTTINLGLSTAKLDTINVAATDTLFGSTNGFTTIGQRATVNGYTVTAVPTTSDVINLGADTKTILTNVSVASNTATGAGGSVDTYSVSNGVMTFVGNDSTAQQITDAITLVDANADQIVTFSASGNTYVVVSGHVAHAANEASVLTLAGLTGVTGLGNTTGGTTTGAGAAAGIIQISSGLTVAAATTADTSSGGSGAQTASSTDCTGFAQQTISNGATGTHTFTNLAAAAILNDASTGTAAGFNIVASQLGTSGSDSILLNLASTTSAHLISSASFSGDATITIANSNSTGQTTTITTLVDPGNTATTVNILGGVATDVLQIGTITDTHLATLNVSPVAAETVAIGAAAANGATATAAIIAGVTGYSALSQAGLAVTLGANVANTTVVNLSGAGDNITASTTTNQITVYDTAANVTVAGGTGADTIVVGANATVSVKSTNTAANAITVGANSAVTLGASDTGPSTVTVAGDTAGTSLTNMVTITNATDSHTILNFFSPTSTTTDTAVDPALGAVTTGINVGAATTLAGAEGIAIQALGNTAVGTHVYDYFQFQGNTYVLEHTSTSASAAATALSSSDIVVKLVGLVELSNFAINAHTVVL